MHPVGTIRLGVQAAFDRVADASGNARLQLNTAGSSTYGASFDPWGVVTNSIGSTVDHYGFASQFTDGETELSYMRARYYDPSTGSFLTRDPLGGGIGQTLSWNGYSYANNDPIDNLDPSGLWTDAVWNPGTADFVKVSTPGIAQTFHQDLSSQWFAASGVGDTATMGQAHASAQQAEQLFPGQAGPAGGYTLGQLYPSLVRLQATVTSLSNTTPSTTNGEDPQSHPKPAVIPPGLPMASSASVEDEPSGWSTGASWTRWGQVGSYTGAGFTVLGVGALFIPPLAPAAGYMLVAGDFVGGLSGFSEAIGGALAQNPTEIAKGLFVMVLGGSGIALGRGVEASAQIAAQAAHLTEAEVPRAARVALAILDLFHNVPFMVPDNNNAGGQ